MARFRKDRLANLIRDVVVEAILRDLSDPRISTLTSVTRVVISGDLQLATVFISVIGSEAEERTTLHGLRHAVGHIRTMLARSLSMRQCPELRFEIDASIKGAAEIQRIIEASLKEDQALAEARGKSSATDAEGSADGVAP